MGKIIEGYGGKLILPATGGTPILNIIGWNGTGGSTYTSYNYSLGNRGTTLYTAVSPDVVTGVGIYGRKRTSGTAVIHVGIYTTSGGLLSTLVHSVNVTVTTTVQWHTASTSFTLTDGVIYAVAFDQGGTGGTFIAYYTAVAGPDQFSVSGELTLPATWTGTGSFAEKWSCYATVER